MMRKPAALLRISDSQALCLRNSHQTGVDSQPRAGLLSRHSPGTLINSLHLMRIRADLSLKMADMMRK
jgi:hypothetical protein